MRRSAAPLCCRRRRQPAWLLLLLATVCTLLAGSSSSSLICAAEPDASGAAAPGELPFSTPPRPDETRISSGHHRDSLRLQRTLDTSGVIGALLKRAETASFALWIEEALRVNVNVNGGEGERLEDSEARRLRLLLKRTNVWTVFAPSNAAVDAFRSGYSPSLPPLSALLAHFVPNQSFVFMPGPRSSYSAPPPPPLVALATACADPSVSILVCDLETLQECEDAASLPVWKDALRASHNFPRHAFRAWLLRSDVIAPNRLAGNGVVHLIDHVLTVQPPEPASSRSKKKREHEHTHSSKKKQQREEEQEEEQEEEEEEASDASNNDDVHSSDTSLVQRAKVHVHVKKAKEVPPPVRLSRHARHGLSSSLRPNATTTRSNDTTTTGATSDSRSGDETEEERPAAGFRPWGHHRPGRHHRGHGVDDDDEQQVEQAEQEGGPQKEVNAEAGPALIQAELAQWGSTPGSEIAPVETTEPASKHAAQQKHARGEHPKKEGPQEASKAKPPSPSDSFSFRGLAFLSVVFLTVLILSIGVARCFLEDPERVDAVWDMLCSCCCCCCPRTALPARSARRARNVSETALPGSGEERPLLPDGGDYQAGGNKPPDL